MTGPDIIAKLRIGLGADVVRVALDEDRGSPVVDVRLCVEIARGTGVLTTTNRGVSVSIDQLSDLIGALQAAEDRARRLGILSGAT